MRIMNHTIMLTCSFIISDTAIFSSVTKITDVNLSCRESTSEAGAIQGSKKRSANEAELEEGLSIDHEIKKSLLIMKFKCMSLCRSLCRSCKCNCNSSIHMYTCMVTYSILAVKRSSSVSWKTKYVSCAERIA